MSGRDGEVRLTRQQAGKIWDATFAARWPEIFDGHPLRPAMERFVRAGWGTDEVRIFIATGELDVTRGMPARRVQVEAEATEQGVQVDGTQLDRMARLAARQGVVSGSV